MRGDEERAATPPEVLLEPLERAEVEVVRRLVEEQQVRVGDDEAGQRRPRLLAARQRRRRPDPVASAEAEPGQRLVDPLVERVAAEDLEPVLEVRVGRLSTRCSRSSAASSRGHRLEVRRPVADGRPEVRRGHERGVEVGLLGEQPDATGRASGTPRRASGSSTPAAIRSSVVLPAPFGPTSPIRSPSAIAASIRSRITNVPTSRWTPSGAGSTSAQPPDRGAVRRARRVAARAGGRRARSGRARSASASAPTLPSPAAQLGPAPAARADWRRLDPRGSRPRPARSPAGSRWHHEQKCVARAADDDPPDRPPAARARLAGALVDVQPLLHLAVALGRRVVVDRRAAALDRLGEDPAELAVQAAARRPAAATGRTGAGGAAPPTAPRRRRCCRRRRGTPGRAAAASAGPCGPGAARRKRRDRERAVERLRARVAVEPRIRRSSGARTARSARTCGCPGTAARGRPRARARAGRTDPPARPPARRTAGRSS